MDVTALRPPATKPTFKIVVFTPESDRASVLDAAFRAGAGRIGAYEQCSFATSGEGTFFGSATTNPTVGQPGRRETVAELRLEIVCPAARLAAVLAAIRAAHSYEEPAIDVYPLQNQPTGPGVGRVGRLDGSMGLDEFARKVAMILDAPDLQFVGDPRREIRSVAIVCGAGDDFLPDAARAGADVLLTGEARFHRASRPKRSDIGLIVAGHHATERPGVEDLAQRISIAFPSLHVWPSRREHDPLRSL